MRIISNRQLKATISPWCKQWSCDESRCHMASCGPELLSIWSVLERSHLRPGDRCTAVACVWLAWRLPPSGDQMPCAAGAGQVQFGPESAETQQTAGHKHSDTLKSHKSCHDVKLQNGRPIADRQAAVLNADVAAGSDRCSLSAKYAASAVLPHRTATERYLPSVVCDWVAWRARGAFARAAEHLLSRNGVQPGCVRDARHGLCQCRADSVGQQSFVLPHNGAAAAEALPCWQMAVQSRRVRAAFVSQPARPAAAARVATRLPDVEEIAWRRGHDARPRDAGD